MMDPGDGSQDPKCPCRRYMGGEFQEIIDLKTCGLIVYKYVPRYIRGHEITRSVYVFYNYLNRNISSTEFISEFDQQKTTCPQCRALTENAKGLLQHIPNIEGKNLKGTCADCCASSHTCVPCEEVVKSFALLNNIKLYDLKDKINNNFNLWQKKLHQLQFTNYDKKSIDYLDLSTPHHPYTNQYRKWTPEKNTSAKEHTTNKLDTCVGIHMADTFNKGKTKTFFRKHVQFCDELDKCCVYQDDLLTNENQSEYEGDYLECENEEENSLETLNGLHKISMNRGEIFDKQIEESLSNDRIIDTSSNAYSMITVAIEPLKPNDEHKTIVEGQIREAPKKEIGVQHCSENIMENINETNIYEEPKKNKQHNRETRVKLYVTYGKHFITKTQKSKIVHMVPHLRGGATVAVNRKELSKTHVQQNEVKKIENIKISSMPLPPKVAVKQNDAKNIEIIKGTRKSYPKTSTPPQKNMVKLSKQHTPENQKRILKDILSRDIKKEIKNNLIDNLPITAKHQVHQYASPDCVICKDSDLNIKLEDWKFLKNRAAKSHALIQRNQIVSSVKKIESGPAESTETIFFKTKFNSLNDVTTTNVISEDMKSKAAEKHAVLQDPDKAKGTFRYTLSNREFIDKGWTILPTEKITRKYMVYRMRPAQPEFDWFAKNKFKGIIHYDTGEKFAEIDDNGQGRWFYRNGRLALDYYNSEDLNAKKRIVIYSSGEVDESGRKYPLTVLAIFDYIGNGIVFDHCGQIRLKYNQSEGVLLDTTVGPESHWKWHSLNEPPVLERVMAETYLKFKDPEISKLGGKDDPGEHIINEDVLQVERKNFVMETQKKTCMKFRPYHIKAKTLKINDKFSLNILEQEKIHILYRDGSTHYKLNIGMILDNKEIVDVHSEDIGKVTNIVEQFPAKTESVDQLQKYIQTAKQVERARQEHTKRILRPPASEHTLMVSSLYSTFF